MPGGRLCFGWIVDLDPRGTVPLVVHGLELSVARILAEAVEGHMTKSTVGGDAVLVGFIFPWHFPVDLSVFAALEVSCREIFEFGVAYVVEDAAVNDLCAWSACSKDRRCLAHSAPARGGKQDDCFACQVVRLEECIDNRRRHVPPDGKSQKDGVVVFDVLDSGGYDGRQEGLATSSVLRLRLSRQSRSALVYGLAGTMANRSLSATRARRHATSFVVPVALKYVTSVLANGVPFVAVVWTLC